MQDCIDIVVYGTTSATETYFFLHSPVDSQFPFVTKLKFFELLHVVNISSFHCTAKFS